MTNQATMQYGDGIEVTAAIPSACAEILAPEAMHFVAKLARAFEGRRQELLQRRVQRQAEIDAGKLPDFLPETEHIRQADWTIAPLPADLQDRRVELTGPADRKMMINGLNSGAKTFMADFEDAHSPTWEGPIQGQINVRDAIRRTITSTSPQGKLYKLNDQIALLLVRPRGWHLDEKHVLIDGQPISGGIFDFGLCFFHNVRQLLTNGTGLYLYLPKLENHLEARLWNDIFVMAQDELHIPRGTIKATVIIETILATFEMDEILYELREHSAGLNCGRWDYIFSMMKTFHNVAEFIFPDRAQITMESHCMRSYTLQTIKTCHRRNAPAIGGMAVQVPIKNDPVANEEAFEHIRADKKREATDGHDGTWIAHPGLVAVAQAEFDALMPTPNQIDKKRDDVHVTAADLLSVPEGTITEQGLRNAISVSLHYLEAWLRGSGSILVNNLMEDTATVEVSRAQIWHWIRHPQGILQDGRKVTIELFHQLMGEEREKLRNAIGEEQWTRRRWTTAAHILDEVITDDQFVAFLTLPAYRYLNELTALGD